MVNDLFRKIGPSFFEEKSGKVISSVFYYSDNRSYICIYDH